MAFGSTMSHIAKQISQGYQNGSIGPGVSSPYSGVSGPYGGPHGGFFGGIIPNFNPFLQDLGSVGPSPMGAIQGILPGGSMQPQPAMIPFGGHGIFGFPIPNPLPQPPLIHPINPFMHFGPWF